jgi:ATP-dependent DNA helicase PIF1
MEQRTNNNSSPPAKKPGSAEAKLTSEQEYVKELVLQGHNVYFTGSAGTGKSYLLQKLIVLLREKHGKKRVGITSTSGIGAEIIGGTTLHSFLGIGIDSDLTEEELLERILSTRSSYARKNWRRLRVLIIDEISMLDGELFDKLEGLARKIRRSNQPFGGIQLVLTGDFCQLPPVGKSPRYCFEAKSWSSCITKTINLTQVFRQKTGWFINYLQAIRFGRLSKKGWENFISLLEREPDWPSDGINPVSLFATSKEAENVNNQELDNLPGPFYVFRAKDQEKEPGKLKELIRDCSAPAELKLKVGAQVMLVANYLEKRLVNGSQGVITGFEKNLPKVKFTNGKELVISERTWEKIEEYDEDNRPLVSASRTQIPLILSWAITIHKSQGQTIERLKVDLSKCFVSGQIYVALSRANDPNYLQVINFPYRRLWCDWKVQKYYSRISVSCPSRE